MKGAAGALLLLAAVSGAAGASEAQSTADGLAILKKMAAAARQLNYQGTFVYKHGSQIETSRIWHLVDASGEYERLETLDGPLREVIRNNDEVTCFYPQTRTIKVEKRASRRFPAVVSEQLTAIAANYVIRRGETDRVAGYDCQITVLEPRDNLRYGHTFCIDSATGLPLRARTFNDKNELVELFAFTQVAIGGSIARDKVKSRYNPKDPGWKLDRSALAQGTEADSGWAVANQPAGFRKVMEVRRTIQGKSAAHLVYSDGLAAVSVFIEPAAAGARQAHELSHQGAINIFTRPHSEHTVTALGEAPAQTVIQFGNSITFRGKP